MKKYEVEIRETLSRVIEVKASSKEEAIVKVEEMHKKSEVVLGGDDFIGYAEFEVVN